MFCTQNRPLKPSAKIAFDNYQSNSCRSMTLHYRSRHLSPTGAGPQEDPFHLRQLKG